MFKNKKTNTNVREIPVPKFKPGDLITDTISNHWREGLIVLHAFENAQRSITVFAVEKSKLLNFASSWGFIHVNETNQN